MALTHDALMKIMTARPGDYKDYGGTIERWDDASKAYPDCSGGCRYFAVLDGALGSDWGVCCNPKSDRVGLLTFEHQAGGAGCYKQDNS